VCWRLDRLGRDLKHLVVLMDELAAWGIGFVSLNEGIDCTTPAGKLQLHILAVPQRRRQRSRRSDFASMRGAPAMAIKELAGHQDLSTTQRYMHLSPAAIDDAIRLLDRRGNAPTFGDMLETGPTAISKSHQ
jgi:hypothetical protein